MLSSKCEAAERYLCLVPPAQRPLVHDCTYLLRLLGDVGIVGRGQCVQGKTKVFVKEAQAQKLEAMKLRVVEKATKVIQRDGRRMVERQRHARRSKVLDGVRQSLELKDPQQLSHWLG